MLDCIQSTWLSDTEYLEWLDRKVEEFRVPLSGSIDLTHVCNLKCTHCYLGDQTRIRKQTAKELGTAKWLALIDEFAEAGCLFLLISGGEPLLRKDFATIYRHIKSKGMLVTVFTNGTLITDSILRLFDDLPPHGVEISLYGATDATYEKITGVKGSFKRCIEGIEKLLAHKINLSLKTMLMTYNRHEFFDIKNMAEAYGVEFRFDAAIFPCFNGDKTPIEFRVAPEEAIEKEFSDKDMIREWKSQLERMEDASISDLLYHCGTGLTTFHIDPFGNLQPCQLVNSLQYNIPKGNFLTGWRTVMPRIREKKAGRDYACNRCEKMALCGLCPAFFELETGSEEIHSEYMCAMGHLRFKALGYTATQRN